MTTNPNTISVTGCDDCPFLDKNDEGVTAFCTRSERNNSDISYKEYRNMFAPYAPLHPDWCPLVTGPVTISLASS